MSNADLKKSVREVLNFPKPGINFYDVTTLFGEAQAFRSAMDRLVQRYEGDRIDAIAGIEARGFVLASALSYALHKDLILIRKSGKLPGPTINESYSLEYGEARLEIHRDAVEPGQRVLIVDDVLATGGTAAASGKLIERLEAEIYGFAFMIELTALGGRTQIAAQDVYSLLSYDD